MRVTYGRIVIRRSVILLAKLQGEGERVYGVATRAGSDGRNARVFTIKLYQIRD